MKSANIVETVKQALQNKTFPLFLYSKGYKFIQQELEEYDKDNTCKLYNQMITMQLADSYP